MKMRHITTNRVAIEAEIEKLYDEIDEWTKKLKEAKSLQDKALLSILKDFEGAQRMAADAYLAQRTAVYNISALRVRIARLENAPDVNYLSG